jgi:hypothetical protein
VGFLRARPDEGADRRGIGHVTDVPEVAARNRGGAARLRARVAAGAEGGEHRAETGQHDERGRRGRGDPEPRPPGAIRRRADAVRGRERVADESPPGEVVERRDGPDDLGPPALQRGEARRVPRPVLEAFPGLGLGEPVVGGERAELPVEERAERLVGVVAKRRGRERGG